MLPHSIAASSLLIMPAMLLTVGALALFPAAPVVRRATCPTMSGTHGNVHGEKGAYVAGTWVPIQDCGEKVRARE